MLLRKLHLCLFGATLASAVLTTGCQPPATSAPSATEPAQSETVIYNKWEVETHRPHKEINQRPPEEQKAYHDWRQAHPEIR